MIRKAWRPILALTVTMLASSAHAAWYQATSKHFVIYANRDPNELRDYATTLEKFDAAVRSWRKLDDPPVGDGNRLTVYVVPSREDVVRLARRGEGVAGFYRGSASGSIAVVPRTVSQGPTQLTGNNVLFHEYAHHLLLSAISTPVPRWLNEGFAEFLSTATIERDGGMQLGRAPQFRAATLTRLRPMALPKLFTSERATLIGPEMDQLYGTSWLLTDYLTFEPNRSGQLTKYLAEVAKGTPSIAAAQNAFGDLNVLQRELASFLARSKISGLMLAPSLLGSPRVEVQPLSAGASAVILARVDSKNGVDAATAEPLAARVRAIATRFPDDVLVERTLAEAELDARHPDAALAAADRALKVSPRDTEAMILKGRAILNGKTVTRAADARVLFIAANKIDPEDPEPLMYFYRTYAEGGARPTANAIAALHYASDLAPQDRSLRINSALQYLRDGQTREAREALVPVAYDPHGGRASDTAKSLIDRIDQGTAPKTGPSLPVDAKADETR